ncbi:hypothetical protein M758_UG293500 [Ceratodon purpureus]|nr:hypothetical protein M758_UG293500 [Ceratodon purpureus]
MSNVNALSYRCCVIQDLLRFGVGGDVFFHNNEHNLNFIILSKMKRIRSLLKRSAQVEIRL